MNLDLGPLTNLLAEKYTSRTVVFAGGLFLCSSHILTIFAPRLEYLYLTLGLLAGTT